MTKFLNAFSKKASTYIGKHSIKNNYDINGWQQFKLILNPEQTFNLLKSLNQPVFLDSSVDPSKGRYDILSAEPKHIINLDSLSTPANLHINHFVDISKQAKQSIPQAFSTLPFVCGLMGFVSYEAGNKLHIKEGRELSSSKLPTYSLAYYSWSYVFDRKTQQGALTFSPQCALKLRARIINLIEHSSLGQDKNFAPLTPTQHPKWQKTLSKSDYAQAFAKAKAYIDAGDCYQVNLAQRLEAHFPHPPLSLYRHLREKVNTPYSCYLSFPNNTHLLCFSPEQFIGIHHRDIETRPIKGTIENDSNHSNSEQLYKSEKNRAENLMIVDLLRNDLSKVCELHSVEVKKLFEVENYKNVHHLVSHIKGKLLPNISELNAFISCFPGGSITGTPKIRAMEIINELEQSGRSAYCGSVFYLNDDGHFDSNILIRSIVHSENTLHCWGGGGIVADSTLDEEYYESLIKIDNLTNILSGTQ